MKRLIGSKKPHVSIVKSDTNNSAVVNSVRSYVTIPVNGHDVQFQLDTGADVTLLNVKDWEAMGKPKLTEPKTLTDASRNTMTNYGKLQCDFELKGTRGNGVAHVVPTESLLGLEWIEQCTDMKYHLDKMINKIKIDKSADLEDLLKRKFGKVFEEGLGLCTKEKASLTLKLGAKPICKKSRPIAHAAKEAWTKS